MALGREGDGRVGCCFSRIFYEACGDPGTHLFALRNRRDQFAPDGEGSRLIAYHVPLSLSTPTVINEKDEKMLSTEQK